MWFLDQPEVLISSGNLFKMQIGRPPSRPLVYVALEVQPSKLLVANPPSDSEAWPNSVSNMGREGNGQDRRDWHSQLPEKSKHCAGGMVSISWSETATADCVHSFVCFCFGSWVEKNIRKSSIASGQGYITHFMGSSMPNN